MMEVSYRFRFHDETGERCCRSYEPPVHEQLIRVPVYDRRARRADWYDAKGFFVDAGVQDNEPSPGRSNSIQHIFYALRIDTVVIAKKPNILCVHVIKGGQKR